MKGLLPWVKFTYLSRKFAIPKESWDYVLLRKIYPHFYNTL
jgi:hypothetical protein